jgi:hypothetical protein
MCGLNSAMLQIAPSTEQRLDVNFIIWPARSKDDVSTSKILDNLFGQVRNHASAIYSGDATGALLFAKIGVSVLAGSGSPNGVMQDPLIK